MEKILIKWLFTFFSKLYHIFFTLFRYDNQRRKHMQSTKYFSFSYAPVRKHRPPSIIKQKLCGLSPQSFIFIYDEAFRLSLIVCQILLFSNPSFHSATPARLYFETSLTFSAIDCESSIQIW